MHTEKKQADPEYKRNFKKVEHKVRENGKKSQPDAELEQINEIAVQSKSKFQEGRKKIKIIVDAKYYTSQLSQDTIDKTIDDVSLRCDDKFEAWGLIVCSESTKLDEYRSNK